MAHLHEDRVLAGGRTQRQLVERQQLAAGLQDAPARLFRGAEAAHLSTTNQNALGWVDSKDQVRPPQAAQASRLQ